MYLFQSTCTSTWHHFQIIVDVVKDIAGAVDWSDRKKDILELRMDSLELRMDSLAQDWHSQEWERDSLVGEEVSASLAPSPISSPCEDPGSGCTPP